MKSAKVAKVILPKGEFVAGNIHTGQSMVQCGAEERRAGRGRQTWTCIQKVHRPPHEVAALLWRRRPNLWSPLTRCPSWRAISGHKP